MVDVAPARGRGGYGGHGGRNGFSSTIRPSGPRWQDSQLRGDLPSLSPHQDEQN